MLDEILILIFSNRQNAEYFKKYYGNTRIYQVLFNEYVNGLKILTEENILKHLKGTKTRTQNNPTSKRKKEC